MEVLVRRNVNSEKKKKNIIADEMEIYIMIAHQFQIPSRQFITNKSNKKGERVPKAFLFLIARPTPNFGAYAF